MPDNDCPEWFAAWAADYCVGLGAGDDLASLILRVWWPAFRAAKYTRADLEAALPRVLMKPPQWPREHLPAVNGAVRAVQAERQPRKGIEAGGDANRCRWCEWQGFVTVPHPIDVRAGRWHEPFRTADVFCTRCNPGRRSYEAVCGLAQEGRVSSGAPMTLCTYELCVAPDWAELLVERDEADRLMRRANDATEGFSPLALVLAHVTKRAVSRAGSATAV